MKKWSVRPHTMTGEGYYEWAIQVDGEFLDLREGRTDMCPEDGDAERLAQFIVDACNRAEMWAALREVKTIEQVAYEHSQHEQQEYPCRICDDLTPSDALSIRGPRVAE